MGRMQRLVYMLGKLGAGEGLRTADVYRTFGVDQKTVKRDISFARGKLGLSIVWDSSAREYRLGPGAALPEFIALRLTVAVSCLTAAASALGVPPALGARIGEDFALNPGLSPDCFIIHPSCTAVSLQCIPWEALSGVSALLGKPVSISDGSCEIRPEVLVFTKEGVFCVGRLNGSAAIGCVEIGQQMPTIQPTGPAPEGGCSPAEIRDFISKRFG